MLRDVQEGWRLKGYGIQLGEDRPFIMCNFRFADDILLIATSREQLTHMLKIL